MSERALAAAILSGGASTRMGAPKESVLFRGRPMIEHVADALASVAPQVVILGAAPSDGGAEDLRARVQVLGDARPRLGPLGGIATLLASGLARRYVVATCDQPMLSRADLEALLACDAPAACLRDAASGEELDPFPCALDASLAGAAAQALERGELGVRRFLRANGLVLVDGPAGCAARARSLNTPEEVAHAEARAD